MYAYPDGHEYVLQRRVYHPGDHLPQEHRGSDGWKVSPDGLWVCCELYQNCYGFNFFFTFYLVKRIVLTFILHVEKRKINSSHKAKLLLSSGWREKAKNLTNNQIKDFSILPAWSRIISLLFEFLMLSPLLILVLLSAAQGPL